MVARGRGDGKGTQLLNGHGVSFWANEDVLEGDARDAVRERGSTKCQSTIHFKRAQVVNVM